MKPEQECKYYLKYNRCSHPEAPNPGHSQCIGMLKCGVYELPKEEVSNG